jgi:thioredoxin-like negative regulator of GroEL
MPVPLFPPLFVWAMGALGAAAAAKVAVKEWRRVNAELDQAKEAADTRTEAEPVTKLKRDPESGVFRPQSGG